MFVPVVIQPPPSPQAQELAGKLADLIRIYKEGDPYLKYNDVKVAMRLAEREVGREFGGSGLQTSVVIALLVAVLLAGIFLFFFIDRSGGGGGPHFSIISIVAGLALVVGLLAAVFALKRR